MKNIIFLSVKYLPTKIMYALCNKDEFALSIVLICRYEKS